MADRVFDQQAIEPRTNADERRQRSGASVGNQMRVHAGRRPARLLADQRRDTGSRLMVPLARRPATLHRSRGPALVLRPSQHYHLGRIGCWGGPCHEVPGSRGNAASKPVDFAPPSRPLDGAVARRGRDLPQAHKDAVRDRVRVRGASDVGPDDGCRPLSPMRATGDRCRQSQGRHVHRGDPAARHRPPVSAEPTHTLADADGTVVRTKSPSTRVGREDGGLGRSSLAIPFDTSFGITGRLALSVNIDPEVPPGF